jgi:nucleoside-diphosphate-sugar epimerase
MQMLSLGSEVSDERVVLVTGGTGFIGRHCLGDLVERNCTVHALSRSPSEAAAPGVTWHVADVLDGERTANVIREIKPTDLLHLAWYAEPGKFWNALDNYTHVAASLRLLEVFSETGGRRAVISGSVAEYDWQYGFCREGVTPLLPATPYGVCKHALHLLAARFAQQTGLSLAWGRVFWLFGPHEHPGRLVASVITALLDQREARVSSGDQRRPFLHVADVASALVALLLGPVEGAVNISASDAPRVRDVVELIAQQIGHPELVRYGAIPSAPSEPPILLADTRRLTEEVGWRPRYDLESGIAQTIDWWKSRRAHS